MFYTYDVKIVMVNNITSIPFDVGYDIDCVLSLGCEYKSGKIWVVYHDINKTHGFNRLIDQQMLFHANL